MATYRLTGRLSAGDLYERYAGLRDGGTPISIQLFLERSSEMRVAQTMAEICRRLQPSPAGVLAPREVGTAHDRLAVISDRVVGVTLQAALQRLISRELLLQPPVGLAIVLDILDVCARSQERGVVHGALLPEAVLLDEDRGLLVGDFGLGSAVQPVVMLRKLLWTKSREPYRAPELAQGTAPTDAADVYAAGAIAYELLTLHKPSPGDRPAQAGARRDSVMAPSRLDRRINTRLDPVLLKALDPSAPRRFRNCQDFAQALRAVVSNMGGVASVQEVKRLAAEVNARESDKTLGPPPWSEAFSLQPVDGSGPILDRTEVLDEASLEKMAPLALPPAPPARAAEDADERTGPMEIRGADPSGPTDAAGRAGWNRPMETISMPQPVAGGGPGEPATVHEGGDADEDNARTAPMRPAGARGAAPRKGFMPSRAEPPPVLPGRQITLDRTPLHAPRPSRWRRSPSVIILINQLRRRKRTLIAISVLALVAALVAGYGIQRLERARKEAELKALFDRRGTPAGDDPGPTVSPSPPPPDAPPYRAPPEEGAGFITVTADQPAWVMIDGSKVEKQTPVFKVPVAPGQRRVAVISAATGERHEVPMTFAPGQIRRVEEKFARGRPAP